MTSMENFENLFESFTKPVNSNYPIEPNKLFQIANENSKVLLSDYSTDEVYYLSEYLKSLQTPTNTVIVPASLSIKKGLLGVYKHAYPKTEVYDYGYLEEMRVVTNISLYSGYLTLSLSPVLSLEHTEDGLKCIYITNNVVKLLLYRNEIPSVWIKLDKGYKFARGCSFEPTNLLIGRTLVKDGQFMEKDGRIYKRSANLIIPSSFIRLFEESLSEDQIIW